MLFVPPSMPFVVPEADAQSDTTPPVITVPSNQNFSTSNSTGSMYYIYISGHWPSAPALSDISATDDVGFALASDVDNGAEQYTTIDFVSNKMSCVRSDGIVLDYSWYGGNDNWYHYPVGTTTITCTATDGAGNVGTASFTVTIIVTTADAPLIIPSTTASAYLNSTSSTGRTLTVNPGNLNDEFVSVGITEWHMLYTITDPNGASVADSLGTWGGFDFIFSGYDSHAHQDRWSVEIPSSWEAGAYTITSSVHSSASWNTDPVVIGPYSTTVTVPADTTPPVVTISELSGTNSVPENQVLTTSNSTGYEFFFFTSSSDTSTNVSCDIDSVLLQSNTSPYHIVYYGVLFPIGTNTVTCTSTDSAGNVGTASFTVTVNAPAATTLAATAYLNATSPTGRTLHVTADNVPVSAHVLITIPTTDTFDAIPDYVYAGKIDTGNWYNTIDDFDMSIPEDWVGEYEIFGLVRQWESGEVTTIDAISTTVTVPDPEAPVEPSITASAYLNDTSSTGRTFALAASNLDPSLYGLSSWDVFILNTIWKDGVQPLWLGGQSSSAYFDVPAGFPMYHSSVIVDGAFQAEIPEDWEAGTYEVQMVSHVGGITTHNSPIMFTVPALPVTATEEEEIVIPGWIKNNAGWWASNQIDDRSFVSGLQWLISNGIMNIPPTEQGVGSDDVIPSWIKNNAEWWADDLIDDRNFVTGLQWLITNGIMIIG